MSCPLSRHAIWGRSYLSAANFTRQSKVLPWVLEDILEGFLSTSAAPKLDVARVQADLCEFRSIYAPESDFGVLKDGSSHTEAIAIYHIAERSQGSVGSLPWRTSAHTPRRDPSQGDQNQRHHKAHDRRRV